MLYVMTIAITYSISEDFSNGVDTITLWAKIDADVVITESCIGMATVGDNLNIGFSGSGSLPVSQKNALDAIVAAHNPPQPGAPINPNETAGDSYGASTVPDTATNNTVMTNIEMSLTTGSSNFIAGGNTSTNTNINTGSSINTGTNNITIGQSTADNITSGYNNTIIGVNSGNTLTTGSGNTIYGNSAEVDNSNSQNRIVIGSGATGTVDNGVFLPGNIAGFTGSNTGNSVIMYNNTDNPGQMGPLENPGTTGSYSLVSDGLGTLSWAESSNTPSTFYSFPLYAGSSWFITHTSYTSINTTSYSGLISFIFRGTSTDNINRCRIVYQKRQNNRNLSIRVVDDPTTPTTTYFESTNLSSATIATVSLGSVTALPASEKLLFVQAKCTSNGSWSNSPTVHLVHFDYN